MLVFGPPARQSVGRVADRVFLKFDLDATTELLLATKCDLPRTSKAGSANVHEHVREAGANVHVHSSMICVSLFDALARKKSVIVVVVGITLSVLVKPPTPSRDRVTYIALRLSPQNK